MKWIPQTCVTQGYLATDLGLTPGTAGQAEGA